MTPLTVVAALVFVILLAAFEVSRRWETAKPNEWLLVIDNGRLLKAGIGLRVFRWPWQQVVRFPSSIYKVPFRAQQVTREMQGLEVSGFVIWVVFRDGEGPFKAYKYLEGLADAGGSPVVNENIARMAESIIRHQVANSTIAEVIANREALRQKVREEMLGVVKGWGVWLETVEITDVMILSSSLFEDLQAPYRQQTHREAESIRLATRTQIEEENLAAETELAKQRADAATERDVYAAQQELERLREEEKLLAERHRIAEAQLAHEHGLARQRTGNELELDNERHQAAMSALRERIELEATLSQTNLAKAALDTIERVYAQLPIDSVKLVNLGPNQGVESLVTQLVAAVRELGREE